MQWTAPTTTTETHSASHTHAAGGCCGRTFFAVFSGSQLKRRPPIVSATIFLFVRRGRLSCVLFRVPALVEVLVELVTSASSSPVRGRVVPSQSVSGVQEVEQQR